MNNLYVYRIVPFANLESILKQGLFCKNNSPKDEQFLTLGSKEIIERRSRTPVKCYPGNVVNDFVPFYFSIRTPMLYNIHTQRNGTQYQQRDIIYLCFRLDDLITDEFKWCYTDGNAAAEITKFFTEIENIEKNIDWHSIRTTDFRTDNADGDRDRVRKKHSEFLVKGYVSSRLINSIVVIDEKKKQEVEVILKQNKREIKVFVNPNNKFYFQ